jgi:hypothetical protein
MSLGLFYNQSPLFSTPHPPFPSFHFPRMCYILCRSHIYWLRPIWYVQVMNFPTCLLSLLTLFNTKAYVEQRNSSSQIVKLGIFPHVFNSRKSVHYVNISAFVILQICNKWWHEASSNIRMIWDKLNILI